MAVPNILTVLTSLHPAELDYHCMTLRGVLPEDFSMGCKENFSPCCNARINSLPTTGQWTDLLPGHPSARTHTNTHTHLPGGGRWAPWLGAVIWWRKSIGTRAPATVGGLCSNNWKMRTRARGEGIVTGIIYTSGVCSTEHTACVWL